MVLAEKPGAGTLWRSKTAVGDLWEQRSREELRSFSRCTGMLTTALQNRIEAKLFISGSLLEFSVLKLSACEIFPWCTNCPLVLLFWSSTCFAQYSLTDCTKSHKIRCMVPDNDLPNLIYMKTISIWLLLWRSKAESNLFVNTCIHPLYFSLMASYQ